MLLDLPRPLNALLLLHHLSPNGSFGPRRVSQRRLRHPADLPGVAPVSDCAAAAGSRVAGD